MAKSGDSFAPASCAFFPRLLRGAATVLRSAARGTCVGVAAAVLAAPASADVLVSNIGQTASGTKALNNKAIAQAFTTGSNVTGYTLTSIEVKFDTVPDSGVRVRLLEGDHDGTAHATLINPASLTAGSLTFTAPWGTRLAVHTTYTVVVDSATSGTLSETNTNTVDSGGASGWSMADSSDVGPVPWTDSASEILIRVNGTVHSAGGTRVSNIGQTDAGGVPVVSDFAQQFQIGDIVPENGYWLSRIRIPYYVDQVVPTAPTHVVSLHSDSSGSIGSQIATFSGPPWPTSDESASYNTRDFTPTSTVTLAANSSYWLVWDMQSNPTHTVGSDTSTIEGKVGTTGSDDEDKQYTWSVADDSRTRAWDSTAWTTSANSMRMEIVATVQPDTPPRVTGAAVDGRELVIDFDRTISVFGRPSTSDFTVTVDGSERGIAARGASVAEHPDRYPRFVRMAVNLASRVFYGETVKVSYSGTSLRSSGGGSPSAVAPFAEQAVRNDTPDYSCPGDATGTYPGCTCDSGTYDLESNACVAAPCNCPQAGARYPDCVCPTSMRYNPSLNICEEIPTSPCGLGNHRHEGRPCHRMSLHHDGLPARICRHERDVGDTTPGGNVGGSPGAGGGGGGPPNRAPVATADIESPALDVGGTIEIDATRHFRDPDGDDLSFSATAEDDTVVSVTVDGSTIRIEGLRHGETMVTRHREGHAKRDRDTGVLRLRGVARRVHGVSRVAVPEGTRSRSRSPSTASGRPTPSCTTWYGRTTTRRRATRTPTTTTPLTATITIPAGETVASLEVTIHDDEDIEPVWEAVHPGPAAASRRAVGVRPLHCPCHRDDRGGGV